MGYNINYVFESKRIYPKKELASSLIGFTGIDNNGLSGIEHSFDSVLTGRRFPSGFPRSSQRWKVDSASYPSNLLEELDSGLKFTVGEYGKPNPL